MRPELDRDLIRRSLAQPEAFRAIFERHYEVVRIYAQRRLGPADGEELAATTFEVAFRHRAGFDGQRFTSARPWLVGIANNLVRRHVRHMAVERRHRPLSIAIPETSPEPDVDRIAAAERWPALREALEGLNPDDRETFLLVVLAELPYRDVAEIVDVPVGTVRSRVNRARRLLRELMDASEAIIEGEALAGDEDE